MGIDPGIGRMGWAIIDGTRQKPIAQAFGCLETDATETLADRLVLVHKKVQELMKTYKPEAMAIEDLFFNKNVKTAFIVGQARGVILLAAAQNKIPISVYTPLAVKSAVSGYGRAEKKQVGRMIQLILHLKTIPTPDDTADALAIALTHAFSKSF